MKNQLKNKFKNNFKSWKKRLTADEFEWLTIELNKCPDQYKHKLFNVLKITVNGCKKCLCR